MQAKQTRNGIKAKATSAIWTICIAMLPSVNDLLLTIRCSRFFATVHPRMRWCALPEDALGRTREIAAGQHTRRKPAGTSGQLLRADSRRA